MKYLLHHRSIRAIQNKKWLGLILLLALGLRLYGIDFEVPHPDDYISVQAAMHFGPAKVTPTGYGLYALYNWPGFTMVYIQGILFSLYFLFGWIGGIFPSLESFRNLYVSDPSSFYLIGRLMSVCFGIGSIGVLYHLSRRLYDQKVALLSSLFLSVSFIHSFHSQFIRPDIPSLFFILLFLICCLMILEQSKLKYYTYAGMLVGVATATKFTSAIMIIPLLVTYIMAEFKQLSNRKNPFEEMRLPRIVFFALGGLLVTGSAAILLSSFPISIASRFTDDAYGRQQIVTFFQFNVKFAVTCGIASIIMGFLLKYSLLARRLILNLFSNKKFISIPIAIVLSFAVCDPLFFIDFKKELYVFLTDANFMGKNDLFVGVDSLGFWGNLLWYVKGPVNWGLGIHFEILAFFGLILTLSRRRKDDIPILAFVLTYVLVISGGNFRWERYAIVLMPFVAMYSAHLIYSLIEKLSSRRIYESKRNAITFIIAVGMIIYPIYNILRYDHLLTQKDTRVFAKEWVERNIPVGSRIGQDAYTGKLSDDLFQINRKYSLGSEPLSYYTENNYHYLLVSDTQYMRYLAEPEKYPTFVDFYNKLFTSGMLIKDFRPRSDLWPYPGDRFDKYHIHISPRIKIYDVRNAV